MPTVAAWKSPAHWRYARACCCSTSRPPGPRPRPLRRPADPPAGRTPPKPAEMLELIRDLKRRGLTIMLIEHKLSLVMQLSARVIARDNGRKIAEGPPDEVRRDPAVI